MANDGVQNFSTNQVVKKCGTSWKVKCFRSDPLEADVSITMQQRGKQKEEKTKDSLKLCQNHAAHQKHESKQRRQQRRRYLDIYFHIQIDIVYQHPSLSQHVCVCVRVRAHRFRRRENVVTFVNSERNYKHVCPATQIYGEVALLRRFRSQKKGGGVALLRRANF